MKKLSLLFFILCLLFCFSNKKMTKSSPIVNRITILDQSELHRKISRNEYIQFIKSYHSAVPLSDWLELYDLSVKEKINPLIILLKVQSEQSLLSSSTNNLTFRMNRACGYGSVVEYTTGSKRYYGFKKQISLCIMFFKENENLIPRVFTSLDCDKKIILPGNSLSATFFKYCPKYDKYPNVDGSLGTGNIILKDIYNGFLSKLFLIRNNFKTDKKIKVLLTFDDSTIWVEKIAKKLKNRKIYAIFFLNRISDTIYSNLINSGFDVGNHTLSHNPKFIYSSKEMIQKDLSGKSSIKLFRPPYLTLAPNIVDEVSKEGYQIILGNSLGKDDNLETILYNLKSLLQNSNERITIIFHNTKVYYDNLDTILNFLSQYCVFIKKDEVTDWCDIYDQRTIYNEIQYFAVPFKRRVKIDTDLCIKNKPGGTYKTIGVIKKGEIVNITMYFDWKWVDRKLKSGEHEWVKLKNGGWIWFSPIKNKEGINNG